MISIILSVVVLILIIIFIRQKKVFKALEEQNKKILSQKKSSEVRLGYLVEHLSPILKEFPYDLEDEKTILVPLGNPIDYFVVTENEIGFVEIKTGVSQLNSNQKLVKKLVEDKKVKWHLIRITK